MWSGSLDGRLKTFDINSSTDSSVGGGGPAHDSAVRCVEYSSEINAIVTGSWDATVKTWDARVAGGGNFSIPFLCDVCLLRKVQVIEPSGTLNFWEF